MGKEQGIEEKKRRNRLKQHSKLLPNKTRNLSRALRTACATPPPPSPPLRAVFQLIRSERKNDVVIATVIRSGHKSRASAITGHVDIDIVPRNDTSALFFPFASRSLVGAKTGSNYCYYFVVGSREIFIDSAGRERERGRGREGRFSEPVSSFGIFQAFFFLF